jgi:hypothetical protein
MSRRPVKAGERRVGTERVALGVSGHEVPVDAAHVLAPADHLPDEALGRLERHGSRAPRPLRTGDDVARVEQLEVHRLREPGMPQPRLTRPDRVLVPTEVDEAVREEVVEGGPGVLGRDGPVELGEAARVRGEPCLDEREHLAGERIGRKPTRPRQRARPRLREGAAILGVEVPAAPGRLPVLHEHAERLAQRPVEVLQPELLAALRVRREVVTRREEVAIGPDVERDPGLARRLPELFLNAVLARLDDDEPVGQPLRPACGRKAAEECRGERGGIFRPRRRREGRVVHRDAVGLEAIPEMTHRREKDGDPRLVRPDVRRLAGDLRHPHAVPARVEAVEGRARAIELVAEHEDEMPHRPRSSDRQAGV